MRYLHYDVFTDTPFEGNQLAVFPDPPPGITAALMQSVAAEMAFSESTFLFPKEGAGDIRMRIFTPAEELPIAGHPTIGTTFALAAEGVIAGGRREFVFELGIGPTPVSLEWEAAALSFAWMTQPLPVFGVEVDPRDALAAAIGVERQDVDDRWPVQVVACGVPFLFVPLSTRAAVDGVAVDRRALERILRDAGSHEVPVFVLTTDRTGAQGDETVYSRMLAPGFGIVEDPATGGASGPLGCYLLRHGLVDAARARAMVSLQGVAMGRPSRIHISIDSDGGAISRVRVGGKAVRVGEGEIYLRAEGTEGTEGTDQTTK